MPAPSLRGLRGLPFFVATNALSLVLAAGMAFPVQAAPPAQHAEQVPGYYRMTVGDFQVTALYDGFIQLNRGLLKGVGEAELQSLLARRFQSDAKEVQTAVNAYLVHTGKQLVLVDAGAAACFGPTLGGTVDNLRAAGYGPEQVDAVLLTHLHPDHACGLATPNGQPAFANATVYVPKAEADFWLSESVAAKAPKANQPFFKMARDSVASYAASGRLKTFSDGDTLVEGVKAVPTPGHTPGHVSYLFTSSGAPLLVWGDLLHSHAVQFARPDVTIEFDTDSKKAIASRRKALEDAANRKLWVAGAHLPFPGIGRVRKEGKAYAWVPTEYAPLPEKR